MSPSWKEICFIAPADKLDDLGARLVDSCAQGQEFESVRCDVFDISTKVHVIGFANEMIAYYRFILILEK